MNIGIDKMESGIVAMKSHINKLARPKGPNPSAKLGQDHKMEFYLLVPDRNWGGVEYCALRK